MDTTDSTPTRAEPTSTAVEAAWRASRPRLVDIGYRMLGSLGEAQDVADEACARLLAADVEQIRDVTGWLVSVTGRLCIDRLRSADRRRRAYVGPFLPEPFVTAADPTTADPAERVTLDDTVRLALLVVLQELTPAERTALVLHDFFAVPYDEVATIVGRTPAACRQLASRARRKVRDHPETPGRRVDEDELEQVAERFAAACRAGAIGPLVAVLDPDVVGDFDHGGAVPGAPVRPVEGAGAVARVLVRAFAGLDATFAVERVNGDPGTVVRVGGRPVAVVAFAVDDGRITVIHAVGNPAKLGHVAVVPD